MVAICTKGVPGVTWDGRVRQGKRKRFCFHKRNQCAHEVSTDTGWNGGESQLIQEAANGTKGQADLLAGHHHAK